MACLISFSHVYQVSENSVLATRSIVSRDLWRGLQSLECVAAQHPARCRGPIMVFRGTLTRRICGVGSLSSVARHSRNLAASPVWPDPLFVG